MPLDPLTDQYIDETYQRLVQTNEDRTEFADGLGQPITFGQTSTGSLLLTASSAGNTITFTKGNGDQFDVTVAGGTITGDYVTTSSFNNFTSSYNTGSFSGSFTGSLQGTASWTNNALTASFVTASNVVGTVTSSSFAITSSYILQAVSSSFASTASLAPNYVLNSVTSSMTVATASYITGSIFTSLNPALSSSFAVSASQAVNSSFASTASYVNSLTQSVIINGGLTVTGSLISTIGFTGSLQGTSSWANNYNETDPIYNAEKGKYLTTGSFGTTQTISGSLIIDQNLIVLGSQSIQYITSSQLNISTNLITVNTATPAIRFGGLAVIDSGSTGTGKTGSILWDSQRDQWVYSNPSGSNYDGAVFLVGPRNITGLGSEVGINEWYAVIGNGDHHMTSSAIYNSGSLIRLETNTQVTGSLIVSAGITGSLQGTASWTNNYNETDPVFIAKSASLATTGSNTFIGNQIITGSLRISGSITGSLQGTASYASDFDDYDYLLATNFRTLYNY